jgi:hypothetical protein
MQQSDAVIKAQFLFEKGNINACYYVELACRNSNVSFNCSWQQATKDSK